ncbi:peptidoglycan-binding protein [Streptomyces sp. ME02-8801-2C]|uniref:peptidoglycan-binding protein n=1 Tax=Streptomyces sp. ME02-8801-2C TaxID=3028680 RepID=UPI0029B3C549|nr:peptidoglycan-binding protein [Streptomyces sp. ME02-8801-2C]MDX3457808.1 peptidoglycan-binding protein [Streptomyces sp. ME02-8801-2C]
MPQDYGSVHRLGTVCGASPDALRSLHRLWALTDTAQRKENGEPSAEAHAAGGEVDGETGDAVTDPVDTCVHEVQQLLHDKGADIGVDSDFGPQTLRRVTAFQVFAGLPPNGIVDDATKKALHSSPKVRMDVWSPEKVRQRIRAVFKEAPDEAVAIADCQSFLDPLHILPNPNGTRNWGVFQISDARLRELGGTPRLALDPAWNLTAAKRLWDKDHDFHDWPNCERAAESAPSSAESPS